MSVRNATHPHAHLPVRDGKTPEGGGVQWHLRDRVIVHENHTDVS